MPANPNRLAVILNMQAAMQGMTGVTYHYPVANAKQVSIDPTLNILTGAGLPDLPAYVLEPTPDGSKEFFPAEQLKEELFVTITGRYDADAADVASKITVAENIAADLETALEADTTRGGHACDTRVMVPSFLMGVGSNIVVVVQPVRVTMYRPYGNGIGS